MEKLINYLKKKNKKDFKIKLGICFSFFISVISIPLCSSFVVMFVVAFVILIMWFLSYNWTKNILINELKKISDGESNCFDINLLEIQYPVEKIFYLEKERPNGDLYFDTRVSIEYMQEKLRVINLSKQEIEGYIELGLENPTKVSIYEFYHILNNYDEKLISLHLDKNKILNHLDKIKLLPSVLNKEYNAASYLANLLKTTGEHKEIENILLKDSGKKTITFDDRRISEKALIEVLDTSASLSFILERINLLSLQKYASQFLNKDRIKDLVVEDKKEYMHYLLSLKNAQLSIEQYSYLKSCLSNFNYSLFIKNNPINLHFNDIQMFVQHWNSDILVIDQKKKNLLHDIVNYDIKQYHSMEKNCIKSEQISANLVDCKNLILNKINEILIGKETVKYMSANK